MKIYDCFAGCGGSRLGFERAGHTIVDGCEIGKWQRRVYEENFGEEPRGKDIKEVNYKKVPDFDALTAGLPCQPFSFANSTGIKGFARPDAQLLFDVLQLVEYKRPAFLLFENVAGLLSDSKGRSFATWLLHLEKMGYDAEWAYFNGASLGMQCGHDHIFLIGWDNKKVCPEKILPKWKSFTVSTWSSLKETRSIIRRITTKERAGFDSSTVVLDEYGFRTLIPEEKEQLLGFPEGWTSIAPVTQREKMLGNVWPPIMSEFLGKFVLPKRRN